jgi:hypothetical protein
VTVWREAKAGQAGIKPGLSAMCPGESEPDQTGMDALRLNHVQDLA